MTIYVDDAYVARCHSFHEPRWCHLFGDAPNPTELHEFAHKIGLDRSWFNRATMQPGAWWLSYYEVTETVRATAVAAGAVEVTIAQYRKLVEQFKN